MQKSWCRIVDAQTYFHAATRTSATATSRLLRAESRDWTLRQRGRRCVGRSRRRSDPATLALSRETNRRRDGHAARHVSSTEQSNGVIAWLPLRSTLISPAATSQIARSTSSHSASPSSRTARLGPGSSRAGPARPVDDGRVNHRPEEDAMESIPLLDRAGRRRSPAKPPASTEALRRTTRAFGTRRIRQP